MITRELKYITFGFDEDTKEISIVKDKIYFNLKRTEWVSLGRFIIRILARSFYRKVKKNV
jgi:hypothetical protein